MLPLVAISMGDPAGIGPELALRAVRDPRVTSVCRPIIYGSRALLARIAVRVNVPLAEAIHEASPADFVADTVQPSLISAMHGRASAAWVDAAIRDCQSGTVAAMCTGPIHKQAWHAAGIPFPGHTEMLADRCGVSGGEAMLMYHDDLAVALVSVHQSIIQAAASLNTQRMVRITRQTAAIVQILRGKQPKIAMLGFNPHAGEGGLFGDEERFIVPAVVELKAAGFDIDGPLPPDTAFTPFARRRYDAWICQYHDQGLIPFKALCFDSGVNVTLGLPIIRTSVDHGTAYDQAWKGTASHDSLVAALVLAARMATT